MPPCSPPLVKSKLTYYFDIYLQPSISFLRTYLKVLVVHTIVHIYTHIHTYIHVLLQELVPTVDNNLAESLMRILDCYLEPYQVRVAY